MLHYSKNIQDLKSPPNNHLESLKGKGQDALIENVKKGFQVCYENVEEKVEEKAEEAK